MDRFVLASEVTNLIPPQMFSESDLVDLGGGNWYLPIQVGSNVIASGMRIIRGDGSTFTKFPEEQDGKIFGFEDPANGAQEIILFFSGKPAIVVPPDYDLRIGGMAFGSAAVAEAFLKSKGNDFSLAVTSYKLNPDGTESLKIKNLTFIQDYTFANSAISSFEDISGIIVQLGNNAFSNCLFLLEVVANSVTLISQNCFEGCAVLHSISFDRLEVIWGYAFANATGLNGKSISFPSLTDLGQGSGNGFVFQGIDNLNLSVPNSFQTNNAGAPDGDLTHIISNGGTINYL